MNRFWSRGLEIIAFFSHDSIISFCSHHMSNKVLVINLKKGLTTTTTTAAKEKGKKKTSKEC